MKKFIFVLLFLLLSTQAEAAELYTLKIQPGPEEGRDTFYGTVYSRDGDPERNVLKLGGWGDHYYSFLGFDVSQVPATAEIISANVGLYHKKTSGSENYGVYERVTEDWDEYGINLSNHPSSINFGFEASLVEVKEYWWVSDVTQVVKGWHNQTYENYGLRLYGQRNSSDAGRQFYSSDYLEDPSLRPYLEITYTLPEEEEEVDPLILQYAPKLAFHEEEDYMPMSTTDFIEASALWTKEGIDTQLLSAEDLTTEAFEIMVDESDTSELYLAFSDPDSAKSFDLAAGKEKYDALGATTTVYYHRMDDGDYTVLQYWYFYAMNNWKEHGGFNNHEGDWESVFVFLDKETKEPKYVAYSAHHNDGDNAWNVAQYDSVRRTWKSSEVVREEDTVTSFVALGSHANYPNNGNGSHRAGAKEDETSEGGLVINTSEYLAGNEIETEDPFWMQYEGLWGADTFASAGGDGPQGPAFIGVGGYERFFSPVAWAGIDAVRSHFTAGGESRIDFQGTGVAMVFEEELPPGKRFEVDPHDEYISFGELEQGVTLLPKFWDIESDMENGTFDVEVSFSYDPQQIDALGGTERALAVFYYNEETAEWEIQPSIVDEEAKTVSFKTNHFSRYALGFVAEEVYIENLFVSLRESLLGSAIEAPAVSNIVRYTHLLENTVGDNDRRAVAAKEALFANVQKQVGKQQENLDDMGRYIEYLLERIALVIE